jgi:hypothetical protein
LVGDQAWAWALAKFDLGERRWLAELVNAYLKAPDLVAERVSRPDDAQLAAVAGVIAGTRKPDRRGHKRGDIDPTHKRAAIEWITEARTRRDQYIAEIQAARKAKKKHPMGWTKKDIERHFDEAVQQYASGLLKLMPLRKPSKKSDKRDEEKESALVDTLKGWTNPSRQTK